MTDKTAAAIDASRNVTISAPMVLVAKWECGETSVRNTIEHDKSAYSCAYGTNRVQQQKTPKDTGHHTTNRDQQWHEYLCHAGIERVSLPVIDKEHEENTAGPEHPGSLRRNREIVKARTEQEYPRKHPQRA